MPLIEITDDDAKDLIDFYVEKQRNIKNQMSVLGASLKELNTKILELKQSLQAKNPSVINNKDGVEYSSKWHWVKKIEFAIRQAGKPLTTKEIVDILTEYQPDYISERRSAIASVSAILSTKSGSHSQHKEFVKIASDWGDYAYDVWKELPEIAATDFKTLIENEMKPKEEEDNSDLPF
jgi:tRNA(Phe) wybutosine-synthesizing methylase Tyw3